MKKKILPLFLLLILLTGCKGAAYTLEDGRYTLRSGTDGGSMPYILIFDGRFHVIQDIAVSYQPSGVIAVNGNEVVMETDFAGERYRWVFRLIGDDTLQYLERRSSIPENRTEWDHDMVFSLAED